MYMYMASLVPRPFEEEEKGPGIHCVRMRYFPSKSWEFIFLSAYLSVNVNLDLRCMPKNHSCWQHFGLKTPAVTNLAITSEQYRQKNNKGHRLTFSRLFYEKMEVSTPRQLSNGSEGTLSDL